MWGSEMCDVLLGWAPLHVSSDRSRDRLRHEGDRVKRVGWRIIHSPVAASNSFNPKALSTDDSKKSHSVAYLPSEATRFYSA